MNGSYVTRRTSALHGDVRCVLRASSAVGIDLVSILMGVGRFLRRLEGGFGCPRSILDELWMVLNWIDGWRGVYGSSWG